MTSKHLNSPELDPTRHGFFTREGGVSGGIYAGLNCGQGSDDAPALVQENRTLAATAVGVQREQLVSLHQIHSTKVVEVKKQWSSARPHADAMVTKTKGIGLGILTADCAPVLFTDPDAGVIAAAHAGWKGAIYGVTDSTIDAMINLGATRENIAATVGPCISQANYEVGMEFFETFADKNADYTRFFINGKEGKMQFDLPAFVLHRLRNSGIKTASWVGECTYASPKKYFSYRRTTHAKEPDYGRQISIIRL
jgi:YfiH family protein